MKPTACIDYQAILPQEIGNFKENTFRSRLKLSCVTKMAHRFSVAIFVACLVIMVGSVVVAHEGHDHSSPTPSPSATKNSNGSAIASLPSTMAALFAFVFSFLVIIRGRV